MRTHKNTNTTLKISDLLQKTEGEKVLLLQRSNTDFAFAWGTNVDQDVESLQDLRSLNRFLQENHGSYIFGYLSYDLKHLFESSLSSKNSNAHNFPLAHFFVPEHVLFCRDGICTYWGEKDPEELENFLKAPLSESTAVSQSSSTDLIAATSKEKYLKKVHGLKNEIQQGNLYEINYCVNFTAKVTKNLSGQELYQKLFERSQAPFSVFYDHPKHQIISASPERYLMRRNKQLLSQPIKGTAKRGNTVEEDEQIARVLQADPKERSENIMITDLVRNDLSKVARKNSVRVDHLCELKSFKTVHQLVSTISCELKEKSRFTEILAATFPMGSMTGAPKISAMEHSEEVETFQRGVYSGSVGYIHPNGNFDFNVVIRSFLRNKEDGTLTASVGGAITIDSDPEKEYEECLLKLQALQEVLR